MRPSEPAKYRVEKVFDKPLPDNHKWFEKSEPLEEKTKLQSFYGALNYIAGSTRPDIAFATNKIARELRSPTKDVFRIAKRVLSY